MGRNTRKCTEKGLISFIPEAPIHQEQDTNDLSTGNSSQRYPEPTNRENGARPHSGFKKWPISNETPRVNLHVLQNIKRLVVPRDEDKKVN